MTARGTGRSRLEWADRLLICTVHWDAFRARPVHYLTALWWWMCGKKLRSRYQMAPLLGHSPNAYRLWLLREETGCGNVAASEAGPPIVVLIDIGAGEEGLCETLRCLATEDVTTLVVGSRDVPTPRHAARLIDWDAAPWVMPIAAGDRIAPGFAAAYRAAIVSAGEEARVVYADDDLLGDKGRASSPHFKPDWNSELFRHFDYISGACLLRAAPDDLIGIETGWIQCLTAKLVDEGRPVHLRRMLHHRRLRPCPSQIAVLATSADELPSVTVIIPTRNRVDLLRTCLKGLSETDYPEIEVIIVDNDSDDPETVAFLADLDPAHYQVLHHAGAFNFSAINNRAARKARGTLLCLLNNDIEVVDGGWLKAMAIQAQRDDVGAVGAQLLYPDGRIQHAGVVTGVGNAAGHAHRFLRPDDEGYFFRHVLPQFTMAVTAACLVVAKDRFIAIGGLDEANFAVAFNDVDLCLKLNERGWQSLYEPRARLIHHESVSRGLDRDPVGAARLGGELSALKRRWRTDETVDPFHHPRLSRASEQFVIDLTGHDVCRAGNGSPPFEI